MLFGLSVHIFRWKFTPGKPYILATILLFTLDTASVAVELVSICTVYSLPFSVFPESDYPSAYPFQITATLDLLFPFAWLSVT